ncbi:hypothetical protein C8R46DRAFT_1342270 [Mycena filopes]|nr:hypothetical protein C8R46DRAFT_1342270 [Mycena filopes]
MPSALATAGLVEVLLETFCCGIYAVLFTAVVYLFRTRHGILPSKKAALWTFLGSHPSVPNHSRGSHWIARIDDTFVGFVHLGGGAAADEFYIDLARPNEVLQATLLVLSSIITDALIHRLYVIFGHRRKIVAFPLAFLFAQTGLLSVLICGGGFIYCFATSHPGQNVRSLSNGWVTTNLVASIVISVYSTGMISWKIRTINTALTKFSERITGAPPLTSLLAILAESAALQTSTTVGILVTFQFGFAGQVVWSGAAPAILGISTLLIHARISLGWAHEPDRPLNPNLSRIDFVANAGSGDVHELGESRK